MTHLGLGYPLTGSRGLDGNENLSKFEVNEICWNNDGDYFFLTTGLGTLQVLSYPDVQKSSLKLFQ